MELKPPIVSVPAATVLIAAGPARTAAQERFEDYAEFTANSHLYGWFGLRIWRAFWNHDPITAVVAICRWC